ncbi:hypothetical protein [Klenkia brasiliensis]|uniref:Uncharacterized protein n=1 Tax=Klenkia brasiliensis TaxID=333142 RepID=A0A1G7RDP8_9ACTN|nr:hypothetical protein [Klenkia brasiliensis]SDG08765.1 hypothetical protein SAMN05660324_1858 [Klenkia brasiliensis]
MPTTELPLPYDPRSPEGLAARWVRWVASCSVLRSPVADETGQDAARNQPGDVWFLAGSHGDGPVTRSCQVPAGRDLFVPAVNVWAVGGPAPVLPEAFGRVHVDGAELLPDEVATPEPFPVRGVFLNGVNRSRKTRPMTVWGLWQLIPALAPGGHDVHVVGGDGHGFVVDVRYQLMVGGPQR